MRRTQPSNSTTKQNNFGLLLVIFKFPLANSISIVIHSDRRINVEDSGSMADIEVIAIKDENCISIGLNTIIISVKEMTTKVQKRGLMINTSRVENNIKLILSIYLKMCYLPGLYHSHELS